MILIGQDLAAIRTGMTVHALDQRARRHSLHRWYDDNGRSYYDVTELAAIRPAPPRNREPELSAAPMLAIVDALIAEHGSVRGVAMHLADLRPDPAWDVWHQRLLRARQRHWVTLTVADEFATALGRNIEGIWQAEARWAS